MFLALLSWRLKWAIVIVHRSSSICLSNVNFHIFNFSSETTEQNSMKLDRKQDLNVLYQVCILQADPKNKMASPTSDLLRHLQLLLWNRWMEFNKTSQKARSQCPPLSKWFFLADPKKNKIAALASDWLTHFWLLLWNRWMEFNKI